MYHHSTKQQMVKVVDRVDEVHWKGNHAKSIRMATEAIETNEAFVRSLYGVQIACELHITCIRLPSWIK